MHTFVPLLVAAAATCAVARPLGPSVKPPLEPQEEYIRDYLLPRLLTPNHLSYDDRAVPPPNEHEWLDKEIERISQMQGDDDSLPPQDLSSWLTDENFLEQIYDDPTAPRSVLSEDFVSPVDDYQSNPPPKDYTAPELVITEFKHGEVTNHDEPPKEKEVFALIPRDKDKDKEVFALTPRDKDFFEPAEKVIVEKSGGPHEGGESIEITPPRETRQNPNLGKTRNLVADSLGPLRAGFTYQAPDSTDVPHHVHVLESDAAESIFGLALIATFGSALAMVIAGFAFGWYTFSKKAKAAADVDYPAYGVTGPTVDLSGDRKLAHSAHMYHYQHQKQQIIAMSRSGMEQRNGSVSDPESEEENEEGDYTVYECPGFATTGEMEVKNPLFSDDPTPATPGNCEIVKPQPTN